MVVIKYPENKIKPTNKQTKYTKNFGKKEFILAYNSRLQPMRVAKLRWQGSEPAGHTTAIVRSREREMCGAHFLVGAPLRFSTHMVQDPLPKGWCCRQWPRSSHISYL